MEEEIIRNYLLGQLAEDERTRLDERLLKDAEFETQLLAEEDDLIDDYLGGVLSMSDRDCFERVFLCFPERHQKLRFAKAFHLQVAKHPFRASADTRVPRSYPTLLRWSYVAATLVLAAGAVWYLTSVIRDKGSRGEPAQSIPTFVLTPLLTRDEGRMRSLDVPTSARQLRLRLEMENDSFQTYQAILESEQGDVVRNWKGLSAQTDANDRRIDLLIDAAELRANLYQIRLQGITPGGTPENLGRYYFRIRR
jgi:hypothetical protein